MSQTLYGARLWQTDGNPANLRYDVIGNNSEQFTAGDIVSVSGGDLIVGTNPVVGVVVKSQTLESDNETVDKVCPAYIPVDENNVYLMGTNSDLTGNANDYGAYYQVVGDTGTLQVDVSSGTKAISLATVGIVKVDPYNEGGSGAGSGLRKCLVKFVNRAFTAKDVG